MTESGATRRMGLLLVVMLALAAGAGCSYLTYRAEDFAEIVDIGVTYSSKPQFALYSSFESILPGGYADLDGWFAGWGGGQFGVTRHYLHAWGAIVWGHEEIGWGEFDKNDPTTLYTQTVGLIGMPVGLGGDSNPNYVPT